MPLVVRGFVRIVHLGLLAAAALLAAGMVNLLLETVIASTAPGGELARSEQPESPSSAAVLDVAQLSRVTGLPLPSGSDAGPERQPGSGPVRTTLPLRLLGTLLSSRAGWSIASVLDLTRQRSSTVMAGDRIQGARVLEIFRDRVIIDHDDRREVIDIAPGEGALGPATAITSRTVPVRSLDENRYELSRSELEEVLRHLDKLGDDARIVAAYKDGHPEGFKLFAIRPDSIYSKLGFVNGDVVRRINGYEINSPANALEAYARLRDASRVDVEIERSGSSVRKTYAIR